MHRVSLLTCTVLFSFQVFAVSEDSILSTDSNIVAGDTVHSSDSLHDTVIETIRDSLSNDSTVAEAHDSATCSTAIDVIIHGDTGQVLPRDTLPPSVHYYRDTLTAPQKTQLRIMGRIKHGIVLLLRHIKHLFFFILFAGILLSVIVLYRRKIDSRRFMTSTRLSIMDREVQLACKHMEDNYADPELSVESICRALVTGPAFLEALFERELGMSVTEFLYHVRINRSKLLLKKDPEIDQEELLNQIGFGDYDLFLRKFNEITGVTVEEYLDSLSKE